MLFKYSIWNWFTSCPKDNSYIMLSEVYQYLYKLNNIKICDNKYKIYTVFFCDQYICNWWPLNLKVHNLVCYLIPLLYFSKISNAAKVIKYANNGKQSRTSLYLVETLIIEFHLMCCFYFMFINLNKKAQYVNRSRLNIDFLCFCCF